MLVRKSHLVITISILEVSQDVINVQVIITLPSVVLQERKIEQMLTYSLDAMPVRMYVVVVLLRIFTLDLLQDMDKIVDAAILR